MIYLTDAERQEVAMLILRAAVAYLEAIVQGQAGNSPDTEEAWQEATNAMYILRGLPTK